MKTILVFASFLFLNTAQALTWNFDQPGDTQGWVATEAQGPGTSPRLPVLQGGVDQGIWTVKLVPYRQGRSPGITLYSPLIGQNSRLFDQASIRLRLVHPHPVTTRFVFSWTNAVNYLFPGNDPEFLAGGCPPNQYCHPRFWLIQQPVRYTTQWQEVTVSNLRTRPATWPGGEEYEILWEDQLNDIRLTMPFIDAGPEDTLSAQSADQVPAAVEIDWIRLTGAREQAGGELQPPAFTRATFGQLFAPPVFYPLGGVEQVSGWEWQEEAGALGDLDGDGDVDLTTRWQSDQQGGWLLGYNDGQGRFTRVQLEHFAGTGFRIKDSFVDGADLDGDRDLDLVLDATTDRLPPQVWLNDPQAGWTQQSLPAFFAPEQLADLDRDGDLDLWGYLRGTLDAQLLYNDGRGHFGPPQQPQPAGGSYYVWTTAFPTVAAHLLPLIWRPPYDPKKQPGLVATYLLASGAQVQEPVPLSAELEPERVVQVGDFDLDGRLDLALDDEGAFFAQGVEGRPALGLKILRQRTKGLMDTTFALPEARYHREPLVTDLNSDGLPDLVLAHDELRDPAILVLIGQGEGRFALEGRYPLPLGRGGPALSADLDGEGHPDLVVFDSFVAEGAGVHVLLNRLGPPDTAVEDLGPPLPSQSRLGAAYPNPFNPGVVIPFALAAPATQVELQIYSLLGQELAGLHLGPLPAGTHRFVWDGTDKRGKPLASGVYLYRLQADGWSAAGKLTKSN